MSFDATRDAYDRYMGRYSDQLAITFLSFTGGEPGQRALDVGCGPGALTQVLATGLGPSHVAAADPSESFVAACSERVCSVCRPSCMRCRTEMSVVRATTSATIRR